MYEAFYGFKEKPFSMLPDPGFLYLSKNHQTALTLLEYGLFNNVGFCVVSGDPGAGKTTILRAMLERVGDDITVGLITNTHQSFGGLLDWILSVFDLHKPGLTHVEMHQVFMEYLIDEYAKNRSVLLIVDEAQNMNADSLEELRMLSNVNSEKDQLLQVVLVGQPALKDMLRKPELMQFAQRIAVDYHLAPLNLEETCGYIQHRLVVAGAQRDVFTPAACERIFNYSGGTPRLINLLCETVLVYGFADQAEMIDVDLVEEMVHERMKDSVVPLMNKDVAREEDSAANKLLEENFPWIGRGNSQEDEDLARKTEATKDDDPVKKKAPAEVPRTDKKPASPTGPQSEKVRQTPAEKPVPVKNKKQKSSASTEKAVLEYTTSSITGEAIRPAVMPEPRAENNNSSLQLLRYGVVAIVIAMVLIAVAIALKNESSTTKNSISPEKSSSEQLNIQQQRETEEAAKKKSEAEKLAREAEEKLAIEEAERLEQLKQEQIKQETLKKEQAAISAREKQRAKQKQIEQERAELERAEKQKAEERRAEKKRAEQERITKEKERKAKEAKYAEEREKRIAAKLEEEKRQLAEQEAKRLEREYLEAERKAAEKLAIEEAEVKQAQSQTNELADGWVEQKTDPKESAAGCTGPTARFKSYCR